MSNQTDYKRLWKNERKLRIIADNKLLQADGVIEMQADIIKKLNNTDESAQPKEDEQKDNKK